MVKDKLDFIIIGAQKAGTTSLFNYLRHHPQVYMLPEKEGPFFSDEQNYRHGWDWYLAEFFGDAPLNLLWGKATPNYMGDPQVPGRIKGILPSVKLIVLLRDPIQRAYSHYLMSFRNGYDHRAFEHAIQASLQPAELNQARKHPNKVNSYVTRGEYGRILARFYNHFSTEQIRVLLYSDLRDTPKQLVKEVFGFLSVDQSFIPPNLGKVYHQGGSRRRFTKLTSFAQTPLIRTLRAQIPARYQRRASYWYHQWTVVARQDDNRVSESARKMLDQHYQEDIELLENLTERSYPWSIKS